MPADHAQAEPPPTVFPGLHTHGRITQPVSANRGLGQVLRRFSPLTLARSALTAQLPRPARALIAGPFDTGSAFIERVRVEPVQFAAVIAAARNFGAIVNDVMLTALYRVVRERAGEAVAAAYPVMVPVDTRRYLPEAQRWTVANLASAVFPQLRGRDGDSFQESLIRVKACMDAYKQNRPGVGTLVLMSMAAVCGGSILRNRYRRAAAGDTRFINLTNFGVLEDGHCRFGDLVPADTYGVGPNEFAPGLLIAISSYQGALQLVVHGNDAHRFGPFARDFLNGIVTELTSNP